MYVRKTLNNISCKEYCNTHNFKYTIIKDELPQKVYIPNYINYSNVIEPITVNFPEIYVAELNDISIIGSNYIMFDDDNNCIYDTPFMDHENRFDLRCSNTFDVNRYNTFIGYNGSGEIFDEGIMLVCGASNNYSHFQLEVLSRLCLINEMSEYDNLPIIVDEVCLRIPQFKEALEMINKQGRKIIPLIRGVGYKVKKLIYLSDLLIFPLNLKPNCILKFDDVVTNDLCVNILNKNLSIESTPFRKIYISRRKSPNARLQNQAAVENIFNQFGYEIIFTEEMSFHDQIKTFSEAEFIAGASGSGLTNIVFANKNAKIIFIQPSGIQSPWYSNIAGILGLKTYFLDGFFSGYSRLPYYQNGFILNEEYLRNFLCELYK